MEEVAELELGVVKGKLSNTMKTSCRTEELDFQQKKPSSKEGRGKDATR